MNPLRDEIVEQFRAIMAEESDLVVQVVNGSYAFEAIRTNRTRDGIIFETTGRNDPEAFAIRAISAETGPIRPGRTITVAGYDANIVDANPDSAGAIIEIICQKRRVAS